MEAFATEKVFLGHFRFHVQAIWPNVCILPVKADGTTERACYFVGLYTQKRKTHSSKRPCNAALSERTEAS